MCPLLYIITFYRYTTTQCPNEEDRIVPTLIFSGTPSGTPFKVLDLPASLINLSGQRLLSRRPTVLPTLPPYHLPMTPVRPKGACPMTKKEREQPPTSSPSLSSPSTSIPPKMQCNSPNAVRYSCPTRRLNPIRQIARGLPSSDRGSYGAP